MIGRAGVAALFGAMMCIVGLARSEAGIEQNNATCRNYGGLLNENGTVCCNSECGECTGAGCGISETLDDPTRNCCKSGITAFCEIKQAAPCLFGVTELSSLAPTSATAGPMSTLTLTSATDGPLSSSANTSGTAAPSSTFASTLTPTPSTAFPGSSPLSFDQTASPTAMPNITASPTAAGTAPGTANGTADGTADGTAPGTANGTADGTESASGAKLLSSSILVTVVACACSAFAIHAATRS